MKKVLFLLLITLFFSSCERKYSYIETIKEYNPEMEMKYQREEIKAKDDVSAYLIAYTIFCKSVRVSLNVEKEQSLLFSRIPISFSLSDSERRKIDFSNDLETEKREIENKILGIELNLNDVDKLLRREVLVDGIRFKMVFRNENVTRIVTDTIVCDKILITSLDSLNLVSKNVYYYLPGKIERGNEWAALHGNVLIIFHENKVENIKRILDD